MASQPSNEDSFAAQTKKNWCKQEDDKFKQIIDRKK